MLIQLWTGTYWNHFGRSHKIQFTPIIMNYSFCDEQCTFFTFRICLFYLFFPLLSSIAKSKRSLQSEIYLISRQKNKWYQQTTPWFIGVGENFFFIFFFSDHVNQTMNSDRRSDTKCAKFEWKRRLAENNDCLSFDKNNMIMRSKFEWILQKNYFIIH